MTPLTRFVSLIALASLAVCPSAQEPENANPADRSGPPLPPATELIGPLVEAHHAHGQFSGTALVADEGEIIYQGAFGLANDDWNIANELDTKFRLGSVTKQFTAMLVLLLVEDGKLELDAPIARYLPDYPSESGSKVTIHHLLNHTSGIPRYREREGWQAEMIHHRSVEEFITEFCSGPLDSEPGTEYRFSNGGYYLLGAIVEAVTGQSYGAALRERVLDPLEMHDTGYEDVRAVIANRATGYEEVLGERRVAPFVEVSNFFASGGLHSTVGDLWKWVQALRSRSLLSGELEQRMFAPGENGYGYGSHIDHRGIWQGGRGFGFSAMIGRLPQHGRCVILLSNSNFSSVPQLAQDIGGIFQGSAPRMPAPRPEDTLARNILDHGIEAGLGTLATMPQLLDHEVGTTMHVLGYRLLEQRRAQDAARLFEFRTRVFPTSPKSWESLGEAQLQAGSRQLALASFRRAFELDPTRSLAKAMLEMLEAK